MKNKIKGFVKEHKWELLGIGVASAVALTGIYLIDKKLGLSGDLKLFKGEEEILSFGNEGIDILTSDDWYVVKNPGTQVSQVLEDLTTGNYTKED